MAMITGLFETHIHVSSLEVSIEFYNALPGLQLARIDKERKIAFYWIGKEGEAMLGLWEKKGQVYPQHFAFRSNTNVILNIAATILRSMQIECYNFFQDGTSKPLVFTWMPAVTIYFRDPDYHELELIAMLPQKPRPEFGIVSYEDWMLIQAGAYVI
jgi:catechol 2,3-dioxygenase-like lactoylglutathione lyase family enzyme